MPCHCSMRACGQQPEAASFSGGDFLSTRGRDRQLNRLWHLGKKPFPHQLQSEDPSSLHNSDLMKEGRAVERLWGCYEDDMLSSP